VKGKPGEVISVDEDGFSVCAQGGQIRVSKVKAEGGKKIAASEFAKEGGLSVGQVLGR
jgi:methionyl-tRNA formyltransferase